MATISREVARDALTALLEAARVGAELSVKTVLGSKATTLQGLWPLITVESAGTRRVSFVFGSNRVAAFLFKVKVWVRQSATGWTRAQALDRLDKIEAEIAAVYEDNKKTTNWELLSIGTTKVIEAAEDGEPYYMEEIPTVMELATN